MDKDTDIDIQHELANPNIVLLSPPDSERDLAAFAICTTDYTGKPLAHVFIGGYPLVEFDLTNLAEGAFQSRMPYPGSSEHRQAAVAYLAAIGAMSEPLVAEFTAAIGSDSEVEVFDYVTEFLDEHAGFEHATNLGIEIRASFL